MKTVIHFNLYDQNSHFFLKFQETVRFTKMNKCKELEVYYNSNIFWEYIRYLSCDMFSHLWNTWDKQKGYDFRNLKWFLYYTHLILKFARLSLSFSLYNLFLNYWRKEHSQFLCVLTNASSISTVFVIVLRLAKVLKVFYLASLNNNLVCSAADVLL